MRELHDELHAMVTNGEVHEHGGCVIDAGYLGRFFTELRGRCYVSLIDYKKENGEEWKPPPLDNTNITDPATGKLLLSKRSDMKMVSHEFWQQLLMLMTSDKGSRKVATPGAAASGWLQVMSEKALADVCRKHAHACRLNEQCERIKEVVALIRKEAPELYFLPSAGNVAEGPDNPLLQCIFTNLLALTYHRDGKWKKPDLCVVSTRWLEHLLKEIEAENGDMTNHEDPCSDLRCKCSNTSVASSRPLCFRALRDNVVPWKGKIREEQWIVVSSQMMEQLKTACKNRWPSLELITTPAQADPCWACRQAARSTEKLTIKVVIIKKSVCVAFTTVDLSSSATVEMAMQELYLGMRGFGKFRQRGVIKERWDTIELYCRPGDKNVETSELAHVATLASKDGVLLTPEAIMTDVGLTPDSVIIVSDIIESPLNAAQDPSTQAQPSVKVLPSLLPSALPSSVVTALIYVTALITALRAPRRCISTQWRQSG